MNEEKQIKSEFSFFRGVAIVYRFFVIALLMYVGINHFVHGNSKLFWQLVGLLVFVEYALHNLVGLWNLFLFDVKDVVEVFEKKKNDDDDSDPPLPPAASCSSLEKNHFLVRLK